MNNISWEELEFDDLDGNLQKFVYYIEPDTVFGKSEWNIFISNDHGLSGRHFTATFRQIDDNTIQCIAINNHNYSEYTDKGIGLHLYPIIQKYLCYKIQSSLRYNTKDDDFLTPDSEKLWKALEKNNQAKYIKEIDRYIFIPIE